MKNIKRFFPILLYIVMVMAVGVPASAQVVNPTASTVLINGTPTAFEAYLIDGNNFFKLRDLAFALNGANKQFAVDWDPVANAISLTSGQPYEAVGGEMGQGDGTAKDAAPTTSRVYLDGVEIELTAYSQKNEGFPVKARETFVFLLPVLVVGYHPRSASAPT